MNPRTPLSPQHGAHRPIGDVARDAVLNTRPARQWEPEANRAEAETASAAHWRGTLRLGPGWAIYRGEAGDNTWHAHHALQLTIGLHGNVVACLAGSDDVIARGVVIGPDRSHRLLGNGTPVVSIYLDGHGTVGRALATHSPGLKCLDDATASAVLAMAKDDPDGAAIGQALLAHWHGASAPPAASTAPAAARRRVRAVLDLLATYASPEIAVDLASLAARASLSPSHFAQCVRAETGLPLRPYLRWQRLQRAVAAALAGNTLTQAAHEAGFADAAHLTRTFRRHFGLAPSTVFANVTAASPVIRSSDPP